MKLIADNKRGRFEYQVHDQWRAGLVLNGSEIKAIRAGKVNINGSYIKPMLSNGVSELWWIGGNISVDDGDATRSRKLLLHRREIHRIVGKLTTSTNTVIPLALGLERGMAKLDVGLASRKNKKDKRETIKKRDVEKSLREEIRQKKAN